MRLILSKHVEAHKPAVAGGGQPISGETVLQARSNGLTFLVIRADGVLVERTMGTDRIMDEENAIQWLNYASLAWVPGTYTEPMQNGFEITGSAV